MTNEQIFDILANCNATSRLLMQELKRRQVSWKTFATHGFKAEAVFKYRAEHPDMDILDCKRAVDAFVERHG